ncbi:MAG: adenylate/guanylate cyclase domain-containing protein [Reyranella sp.]
MTDGLSTKESIAPPRRRIAMFMVLAAAFTVVALVSGIAYFSLLYGATVTTEKMLHDRTHRLVEDEVRRIKELLDPIAAQLDLFAILAGAQHIERVSSEGLAEALSLAVVRMPGVAMAEFQGVDRHIHRVVRMPDGSYLYDDTVQAEHSLYLLEGRLWQAGPRVFWSPPLWSSEIGQTVIKVGVPIESADGALAGAFVVTVAIGELSRRISEATDGGAGVYFILVDRNKVLAHHRLINPRGLDLSVVTPLPAIDGVNDAVLAAIWSKPAPSMWFDPDIHDLGHVAEVQGKKWLFVHQPVAGYGPSPWLVGRYFPIGEVTSTISNLASGAMVGAATLIFAFLLATFVSLRVGRLIGTITLAARAIGRLELDQVHYLPSRVREIDDAGYSLDRARAALRWFGAYVPKGLIPRIMEAGEAGLPSQKELVTVMFTDIVQFSDETRGLVGDEVVELLNEHFTLLHTCIERECGVVDKYIGDAVMAVWGGISGPSDHADAAVRAALDIVRTVQDDNVTRRSAGKRPVRIRVGIHTGPVVAGNIGSIGRVNYTVVGDSVNVAQHLEQTGKEFMAISDEVIVLVSADTVAALQEHSLISLFQGATVFRFGKTDSEAVEYFRVPLV